MVTERKPNPVRGRVILEVTPRHAILYLCDRQGYVTDQEIFRYPVVMTNGECAEECRDLFDLLYDAINDVVNAELQDSPPDSPESD